MIQKELFIPNPVLRIDFIKKELRKHLSIREAEVILTSFLKVYSVVENKMIIDSWIDLVKSEKLSLKMFFKQCITSDNRVLWLIVDKLP